jgi:phage FluMu gp28-like protein
MPEPLNYFLPYQIAWIRDESKTAVAEKSRRIGLTYAESYRSVERRLTNATHHYFASRDKESAGEFIEYCKMWARVFGAVAEDLGEQMIDEEKDLRAFVLRFKNNARIVALSSNPEAFRSKGGDVTLDEFAFHRDGRKVLKGANASAKVWGHNVRIISTHNGEGSLFNTIIKSIRDGKRNWGLHRITLEDAAAEGLVEKIKRLDKPDAAERAKFLAEIRDDCIDQSEWDEEYMCVPSSEQSSLLTYDLIGSCEDSRLALCGVEDLGAGKVLYAGFDVGRKKDLSVLWVLEKLGDVFYTRLVLELEKVNYTAQERILNLLMGNPCVKRLCIDSTGIGGMLAERQSDRWGKYRAEAVNFSAPVKSELAMPLRRLFEDKLIRIPQNAAIADDLHKVRKIVTAAGNLRLDADRDDAGHADRFWALALAYHGANDLKLPTPKSRMARPAGM